MLIFGGLGVGGSEIRKLRKEAKRGEEVISGLAEGLQIEILVGTMQEQACSYMDRGSERLFGKGGQLAKLENNSAGVSKGVSLCWQLPNLVRWWEPRN